MTATKEPETQTNSELTLTAMDVQFSELDSRSHSNLASLAGPWTGSLFVHLCLLIVLALVIVPFTQPSDGDIELVCDTTITDLSIDETIVAEFTMDDLTSSGEIAPPHQMLAMANNSIASDFKPASALLLNEAIDQQEELGNEWSPTSERKDFVVPPKPTNKATSSQLRQANTVADAVDGIAQEIAGLRQLGNVSVAWLFDASISLKDDHQRVAARLPKIFQEIEDRKKKSSYAISHVAASFGKRFETLVKPTRDARRIRKAMLGIRIDSSGVENTFSAVEAAIENYRVSGQQLLIVVWTDESSDDSGKLESVIETCKRHQVQVSVIGPTAVLSRNTGYHFFKPKRNSIPVLLPVRKGPDSAFNEKIYLPKWHKNLRFNPLREPIWQGGVEHEYISSGSSPFALTRLALATNGSYTIFDERLERGPFRIKRMAAYRPDYRHPTEVLQDINSHPLRKAVVDCAARTRESRLFVPPMQIGLPGKTNAEFAKYLSRTLNGFGPILQKHDSELETMLQRFEMLEAEFIYEPSPRWQAWYDYTKGSLLAWQITLHEYMRMSEILKRSRFGQNTNAIAMLPDNRLSSYSQPRAANAKRHLRRCMELHPGTPWAFLAEQRLSTPWGLRYKEMTVQLVKSRGGGGRRGGGGGIPNL